MTLYVLDAWGPYSFLFGPVVAFALLGLLVLALRWTFSRGSSLVTRRATKGAEDAYGLLVPIAAAVTPQHAEATSKTLRDAGIRATIVDTEQGLRVMVFADDEAQARVVLAA